MRDKVERELLSWAKSFLIAFVCFLLIRNFIFATYRIQGDSMEPTFQDGDKVLVWKLFYGENAIDRFDTIIFHSGNNEDFIKRVIALPGDKIAYRNDHLYVNNKKIAEPFLNTERKDQLAGEKLTGDFTLDSIANVQEIPKGRVLVLGDNRRSSYDSRHFGLISTKRIVGKAVWRFWPINKMQVHF